MPQTVYRSDLAHLAPGMPNYDALPAHLRQLADAARDALDACARLTLAASDAHTAAQLTPAAIFGALARHSWDTWQEIERHGAALLAVQTPAVMAAIRAEQDAAHAQAADTAASEAAARLAAVPGPAQLAAQAAGAACTALTNAARAADAAGEGLLAGLGAGACATAAEIAAGARALDAGANAGA